MALEIGLKDSRLEKRYGELVRQTNVEAGGWGAGPTTASLASRYDFNGRRLLDGAEPRKVIVVPDRLVNLVA